MAYEQPAPAITEQRHEELHHLAAYAHNRPDVLEQLRTGLPEHEAAFLGLCVQIELGRNKARLDTLVEIEDEKQQARDAAKLKKLEREAAARGSVLSRILVEDAWQTLVQPAPLVPNVIYSGAVGVLLGDSQVGKTWVMLSIAAAAAHGMQWPPRGPSFERLEPLPVLYVAAEDGGSIKKRLNTWERAHSRQFPSPGVTFHIHPSSINLLDPVQVDELCAAVHERGYRFAAFDTVAASLGGEEEGNPQFSLVVQHMRKVAAAMPGGGAVFLVHHFGKDKTKGARGGSALFNDSDVFWELHGDLDLMEMRNTKWKIDAVRRTWRLTLDRSDEEKIHIRADGRPMSVNITNAPEDKYLALSNAILKVVKERSKENQGFGPARGVIKDCVNEMNVKFRDVELSQRLERMVADRVLMTSKRGVQVRYRLPGVQEALPGLESNDTE